MNPEQSPASQPIDNSILKAPGYNVLAPISIQIISLLLIVFGVWSTTFYIRFFGVVSLPSLLEYGFFGIGPFERIATFLEFVMLIFSVFVIIAGFGLRRLKKWSLYFLGVLSVLSLVGLVSGGSFWSIWLLICFGVVLRHKNLFV